MFTWLKKWLQPAPIARSTARLAVEALDDRLMPSADIAVLGARLEAPTVIRFEYRVTDTSGPFEVGVYRSADAVFDDADARVGGAAVTPGASGGAQVGSVTLAGELPTDLTRKYVLVVADPGGAIAEGSEANNAASFRKLAVAGVAHGLTLNGLPPTWLAPMTASLKAEGYDAAIPFVWTPLSQIPGTTPIAAQLLAAQVRLTAAGLAGPNDAVDVHLIGHSRGTTVVSQAFQLLESNPGLRAVRVGYYTQTLLDPHVADNVGGTAAALAQFGANTGSVPAALLSYDRTRLTARLFAAGTIAFQAASRDPAAFAPASVDRVEVFYQQLRWDQTAPGSVERLLGANFLAPDPASIKALGGQTIRATDLSPLGIGHYEVPLYYLANVVSTLG